MKRLALIFIIAPCILFAETEPKHDLGLSAFLLEVKYNSESHLATQLYFAKDSIKIEKFVIKYNLLRTHLDAFIVQMQSEMIVKNKPLVFKKVNRSLTKKNKKRVEKYLEKIKYIDTIYNDFLSMKIDVVRQDAIGADVVAGLIGTAVTAGIEIFKNIKETKMKKVTSLNAILETLKLQSSVEIMKQIKELKTDSTN